MILATKRIFESNGIWHFRFSPGLTVVRDRVLPPVRSKWLVLKWKGVGGPGEIERVASSSSEGIVETAFKH